MSLSADDILNADDIQIEALDMPEWGGEVFIRVLSGRDRDAFEAATSGDDPNRLKDFRARFASMVLCNEKGEKLFMPAQIQAISINCSAKALDKVLNAGLKLNALDNESFKELEENLEDTLAGASGSG